MTAPKLTGTQRRLLSEWIRNKPKGGFMFGPAIRVAKTLEALGLMVVEETAICVAILSAGSYVHERGNCSGC